MLCAICHERPATVHVTTMIEGQSHKADYCEQCAPHLPSRTEAGARVDPKNGSQVGHRRRDGFLYQKGPPSGASKVAVVVLLSRGR